MNHGLYSLSEISKKYNFPSIKVLKSVLKKYYKNNAKKPFNSKYLFSQKEKDRMKLLYLEGGCSLSKIALEYSVSSYKIKQILMEDNNCRMKLDLKNKNRVQRLDISDEEKDRIINDLQNGKSLGFLKNKYSLSDGKLKKILNSDPRGREVLYRNLQVRSVKIPIEEIADAYRRTDLKSLSKKYNISETSLRFKLKQEYGNDYTKVLGKHPNKIKIMNEIASLYENGYTIPQIASQQGCNKQKVFNIINRYYQLNNKIKPKILNKEAFLKETKSVKSIEDIIDKFKAIGYHIPERYIQEYLKNNNEIDIRKVKDIVVKQLAQINERGKQPNLIKPFELPNYIKKKGYSNKYYATALLYKVILDNNLSNEILDSIENDDVKEAVNILIRLNNKDEEIKNYPDNKLINVIHNAENELNKVKNNDKLREIEIGE